MKKLVIATAMSLFAMTGYANAACRTMHQVSDNMMKLGYLEDWEGDNNRDVLDFVQAYSRMWCGAKSCKTDSDAVLKADHVIVYTGKDDRAVFFNRKGCKSFSIVHRRGDLTSIW
ncbi:hypothetical protein [Brucella pseudintermedia]|uniref:Uncharacterized protein n=1 Tax=Brucella pseudintermedia TaxID=370111 RepID=A0ABY5UC08_9HYPH|nr:hypothetical protein [Brucella pseudintermedia]KAB2677288.1 hypothetical protein F9K78_21510 [Brucella pseudintermedia]UWL60262.1 hypothetical protein NIK97_00330 [Brucella pseudintermedia]